MTKQNAASGRFFLLDRLLRSSERFSLWAVWVSGFITLSSVLLISFEVVARKFFGFTTGGADELSSYAFAISTAWSLAFAVLQRANVRVDALYGKFPIRVCAFLDWLSLIAMGIFMVYMTRYAFDVVGTSWENQSTATTPLATPLWIPQGLWFMGLIWMCLVLAIMMARASIALITGDLQTVRTLCGVRSIQEEADEEAANSKRLVKEAAL